MAKIELTPSLYGKVVNEVFVDEKSWKGADVLVIRFDDGTEISVTYSEERGLDYMIYPTNA